MKNSEGSQNWMRQQEVGVHSGSKNNSNPNVQLEKE